MTCEMAEPGYPPMFPMVREAEFKREPGSLRTPLRVRLIVEQPEREKPRMAIAKARVMRRFIMSGGMGFWLAAPFRVGGGEDSRSRVPKSILKGGVCCAFGRVR